MSDHDTSHDFDAAAERDGNEGLLARLQAQYQKDPADRENALRLAQLYADMGWLNQSGELYEGLLAQTPADYTLLLAYANLLYVRREIDKSIATYRRLTALKPGRIEGWNNLGIVLFDTADRDGARSCFEKVLAVEPENCGALLNLGNCQAAMGEVEKALASFKQVVALRPDFSDGWYNLGNALLNLRRYDEAATMFERALRIKPEFPSALKNLGYACEQRGDTAKAEEYYLRALGFNRADASLHVNIASVNIAGERYDAARDHLLKAVKLAPRDASAWMGLRDLSLRMGDIATYVKATLAIAARLEPANLAASARLLLRLSLVDSAGAVLRVATERNLDHPELDAERMHYLLLTADKVSARMLYRKLSGMQFRSDPVNAALAGYALLSGSFDAALAHAAQVKEPGLAVERICWEALLGKRDISAARVRIEQHLATEPDCGIAWFLLARIAVSSFDEALARLCIIRAFDAGFTEWELLDEAPELKALAEVILGSTVS